MPTLITHAAVGLGLAKMYAAEPMPPLYWGLSAGLAMLPDIDVLAFSLGIPYGARFGHRGFVHSLCCAALTSMVVALLAFQAFAEPWWQLWGFFFVVMASHGILDAFTNGGLGIALLAPFDDTRYFFPWRPVQVCVIGFRLFHPWNIRALFSEVFWIWLPLAALVGGAMIFRGSFGT
jgi:inner membrane protein